MELDCRPEAGGIIEIKCVFYLLDIIHVDPGDFGLSVHMYLQFSWLDNRLEADMLARFDD